MVMDTKRVVSPKEYLTLERQALDKSEFFNGEIIPMAGVTRNHNRIRDNVNGKILYHLEEATCQSFSSDMRVHIPATGLYAYPDLVIVCGEPELLPDEFDNLLNPTVLLEVLSEGTEDYDRGRKFVRYRSIPSFQEIPKALTWKFGAKMISVNGRLLSKFLTQWANLPFRPSA